ncbi:Ig-like domain-containing protein [Anaerolineales bacterium HSG6]|nr:Ig-like domain-containing protein [Anaerolineales bacterium HSG6]
MRYSKRLLTVTLLFATLTLMGAVTPTVVDGMVSLKPAMLTPTLPPSGILEIQRVLPADGLEGVGRQRPITVHFAQPVVSLSAIEDEDELPDILSFDPLMTGTGRWVDTSTYQFKPDGQFQSSTTYTARIDKGLTDALGEYTLPADYTWQFTIMGPTPMPTSASKGDLEIVRVSPNDGDKMVRRDSKVVVYFERPVVSLGAIESADDLPQPIIFEPAINGIGEWIDTATYQFTPSSAGWRRGETYTAFIEQGLADTFGEYSLVDDFTWQFTIVSPTPTPRPSPTPTRVPLMVKRVLPERADNSVSPYSSITIEFSGDMFRQGVEEAFQMSADGKLVDLAGQFEWQTNPETLIFSPDEPLQPETTYRVLLPKGLESELGDDKTVDELNSFFETAPKPKIIQIMPNTGIIDPGEPIFIKLNNPIDRDSLILGETVLITPTIPVTHILIQRPYKRGGSDDSEVEINLSLEFSGQYTITLGRDIADTFGQTLGVTTTLVYTTKPQAALLFIESPDPVVVYSAYAPTTILVTARNVNQIDFDLYRLPTGDFMAINEVWGEFWQKFKPNEKTLIDSWSLELELAQDEKLLLPVNIAESIGQGSALSPGIYYLEARVDRKQLFLNTDWTSNADDFEHIILIVTKHNLIFKETSDEGLVWVTDLQSGQPVPNVQVNFVGNNNRQETATDAEGVGMVEYQKSEALFDLRYVFVGDMDNPDENFSVTSNYWTDGIKLYQFNDVRIESTQALYYGYFYTHRGLYRPGNTVHFKGIIRRNDDADYAIPTAFEMVNVVIRDEMGQEVFDGELPLNEMGTVNGTFQLASDAALGTYSIRAKYAAQEFYDEFEVSAYRLPEYLVQVWTDEARYAQGATISVNVSSEFFFGGPVSNSHVRWTVLSDDFSYRYQDMTAYDFLDDAYNAAEIDPIHFGFGQVIAEGEGETDENGNFNFELTADINGNLSTQLYTIDVAVTDINNQEVAAQARVLVHKSRFLMGLKPERLVGRINEPNPVNVLLVDWFSQPVANQEVQVVVAGFERYSAQHLDWEASYYQGQDVFYWKTSNREVPLITTTLTTDENGMAVLDFVPDKGGIYKFIGIATDEAGNTIRSSTFSWISGEEYVNWGQLNTDRFKLVADKPEYNVGDTAKILVPHPYSSTVTALVTLERGHIYDYRTVVLENNSQLIEVPITDDMAPNMFVSVAVVQGGDASGFQNLDSLLPTFKMAYVELPISAAAKALNIVMTPNKPETESYQPRETVSYNISVTNAYNEPVKTELSLALVDKAILSLAPETPGQLLGQFWRQRGLGVQTASNLTKAVADFNRDVLKKKGGDGCPDCGGLGEKGFGKSRRNFLDTVLWLADFVTDENGQGTIEATLPDNLTTWTMTGIGVTGASTLVGESTTDIVSSQPVLVRPVTPRFLVTGDEAFLGIIVQNNSDLEQTVDVSFEASGLMVGDWRVESGDWHGDGQPTVTVAPGERLKVEYHVGVEVTQQAVLTMSATGGDYRDSLVFDLPILRDSTPETVATSGILEEDGDRSEAVELPDSYDPTQGDLTIKLDGSLAAGMRDGLDYLEHYEYECTEQTVSRFLPNVVTYRAYEALNLENPELAEKLPDLVSHGRQKLYKHHHADGGWGWWVNDNSHPMLTAYVMQGFIEAKRAGFTVNEGVFQSGLNYLEENLESPRSFRSWWRANRQAFMLYVLAEGGQGDLGRSIALFEEREQLSHYGKAFLLMAIYMLDPEASQVETLINDLSSAAEVSATGIHWTEGKVDYWSMNTDTRSTAIIIGALSRVDPENPVLPKAVRWLMTARSAGGYWRTTQETAWSIIGLTNWMVATGELDGNYDWQVTLNSDSLGEGHYDADNIDQTMELRAEITDLLADVPNKLTIERDGLTEQGNLYYGAYLTYYKPVDEVEALDRGIKVWRSYQLQHADSRKVITQAHVGDVIRVTVNVTVPSERHFVVIEDPLPAGTEPIDPNLATVSVSEKLAINDDRHAFSHTELRDDKAVLFATTLRKGTYKYTYFVRATVPGVYRVIPTHAEEMYFPEVFGRGDGMVFRVRGE